MEKAEWEAEFKRVYNSFYPDCDEKFQRMLQSVTLVESKLDETEDTLITTWTAYLSCYPACPEEALFGSDIPGSNPSISPAAIDAFNDWEHNGVELSRFFD
jgi:hypothetical protein